MSLESNIIINSFSILLMCVILFHSYRNVEKKTLQNRLYILMIQLTIFLLFFDILGRFDGNPDSVFPVLNHVGNFLIFLLSPVLPSIWVIYVHFQIYRDEKKALRLLFPLAVLNAVHALIVLLSQYTGWLYTIDSANIYQRGPLYFLSSGFSAALLMATFILTVRNRKKLDNKYFFSLIFFGVPPFIGVTLQTYIYGVSLILNSVVLSLLIVLLDIQENSINTDYLTGINNRQKLEYALRKKVEMSSEDNTFSLVMLDIDNFKNINDTFGHEAGDTALKAAATLLQGCLRSMDFIARFGGDEFYLIMDISDKKYLEAAVGRIERSIEKFNASKVLPYDLVFSIGYDVYDDSSSMNADEFMKHVDTLMYQDKRRKKVIS